jgi:hypothetical protein
MMEWRDQVAVVTGGGRGIGRATVWGQPQTPSGIFLTITAPCS